MHCMADNSPQREISTSSSMQGPQHLDDCCHVLQVMKLGQLEITDGWMDGEKEVYKFTTKPNVSIPQSLNQYLPGGELVYVGEQ